MSLNRRSFLALLSMALPGCAWLKPKPDPALSAPHSNCGCSAEQFKFPNAPHAPWSRPDLVIIDDIEFDELEFNSLDAHQLKMHNYTCQSDLGKDMGCAVHCGPRCKHQMNNRFCTRVEGHDGPCAMKPLFLDFTELDDGKAFREWFSCKDVKDGKAKIVRGGCNAHQARYDHSIADNGSTYG